MKTRHDLSQLNWRLSGWTPHLWRMMQTMELGETPDAKVLALREVWRSRKAEK